MEESGHEAGGLMADVRRIVRSVGDLAHNRIQLFLLELKEERIRVMEAVALAAAFVISAIMALVLVTFLIVLIFWDYRILVVVLLTAVYGGMAVAMFLSLRHRMRNWRSFTATQEQFKKDRECLEEAN